MRNFISEDDIEQAILAKLKQAPFQYALLCAMRLIRMLILVREYSFLEMTIRLSRRNSFLSLAKEY